MTAAAVMLLLVPLWPGLLGLATLADHVEDLGGRARHHLPGLLEIRLGDGVALGARLEHRAPEAQRQRASAAQR